MLTVLLLNLLIHLVIARHVIPIVELAMIINMLVLLALLENICKENIVEINALMDTSLIKSVGNAGNVLLYVGNVRPS